LYDSLKINETNLYNNRVSTKIEVDLFEDNTLDLSLYVIGKNGNVNTKPSKVINILSEIENIEDKVINNLTEQIDYENNIIKFTWKKLNNKDVTYSVYIKDNKDYDSVFILYENNLQDNFISIPMKEDFDIDIYVVGSKYGKFSKQSNIINVKK